MCIGITAVAFIALILVISASVKLISDAETGLSPLGPVLKVVFWRSANAWSGSIANVVFDIENIAININNGNVKFVNLNIITSLY